MEDPSDVDMRGLAPPALVSGFTREERMAGHRIVHNYHTALPATRHTVSRIDPVVRVEQYEIRAPLTREACRLWNSSALETA